MSLPDEALAKACCADLYQSDLARLILGDTLHPGGLALTHRLGKLLGIQPGQWVADLASGRGTSATAVSRSFKCNVVGVEFGAAAVAEARARSLSAPAAPRALFLRGDAENPPLKPGAFDAVFCECSMSLFLDKEGAVGQAARLLRPGGKFGLSDVTVAPGCLPAGLDNDVGRMLCLSDALDQSGYLRLLRDGGLKVVLQEDASPEILKILDDVDSKLGALTAWQSLAGPAAPESALVEQVAGLTATLRDLVKRGKLGYWVFVAEKPA